MCVWLCKNQLNSTLVLSQSKGCLFIALFSSAKLSSHSISHIPHTFLLLLIRGVEQPQQPHITHRSFHDATTLFCTPNESTSNDSTTDFNVENDCAAKKRLLNIQKRNVMAAQLWVKWCASQTIVGVPVVMHGLLPVVLWLFCSLQKTSYNLK